MTPAAVPAIPRTNNLALAFQELFTIVLRTRFDVQRWNSAQDMRAHLRQRVVASTQNVRAIGYSDEATQMALYAIIGFLDESVLSSPDPVFGNWAGKTLQQEMFGSNIAGEMFFRHVADLLNRPESSEVADILELHCLCLQLGFRGRFTFGDASEIDAIIRRIREKIVRIRGPISLARAEAPPAAPKLPTRDRWVRNLSFAALALALLTLISYLGFLLLLRPSAPDSTHADLDRNAITLPREISR